MFIPKLRKAAPILLIAFNIVVLLWTLKQFIGECRLTHQQQREDKKVLHICFNQFMIFLQTSATVLNVLLCIT